MLTAWMTYSNIKLCLQDGETGSVLSQGVQVQLTDAFTLRQLSPGGSRLQTEADGFPPSMATAMDSY